MVDTARVAVYLQCTLHYTAGTLHFGLGKPKSIGTGERLNLSKKTDRFDPRDLHLE